MISAIPDATYTHVRRGKLVWSLPDYYPTDKSLKTRLLSERVLHTRNTFLILAVFVSYAIDAACKLSVD